MTGEDGNDDEEEEEKKVAVAVVVKDFKVYIVVVGIKLICVMACNFSDQKEKHDGLSQPLTQPFASPQSTSAAFKTTKN